jgi:hypothetical protein
MSAKKVITRFCTAFVGALMFLVLGMTGAASAYSVNVSGPGATVVAHGAYGDISASGPLSKVYVSGNYDGGHGCGNYCQPKPNPCQNHCQNPCEQNRCGCENECEEKKCWYKHYNYDSCCKEDKAKHYSYDHDKHWYKKHW